MRRACLGLLAFCVHCAREVPPPVTPDVPLASATPIAAKPTPPPSCHATAFRTPATQADIDAGLAKLDALEKRAALTFDADASKPSLTGNDVFGRTDPKTNTLRAGTLEPLVAEAAALDDALRAVRPTAIIAARALVRVGKIYDALTAALEAWTPTAFTVAQQAKLQQLQSSGRTQLVQLALQANASVTKALQARRNGEADATRTPRTLARFSFSSWRRRAPRSPSNARASKRGCTRSFRSPMRAGRPALARTRRRIRLRACSTS